MKRLCIYLTFDQQNIVDEYIGYMLKELKTCVETLVVVCNALEIRQGRDILEKYADAVFLRENKGFDIGGFKDALCNLIRWEEVLKYDELVLVNDSFFGPFRPMKSIFDEMELKQADFWGLIKQGRRMEAGFYYPEHIQSFFMTICYKMLHSKEYHEYWETMPYYTSIIEAINNYEVMFTQYFADLGFSYSTLANTEINDSSNIYNNQIQYLTLPYELIKKRGFPFLKKRPITYYMSNMQTQENFRLAMEYIENETDYNVNLIWNNIIRTIDISDIQRSFALNYIISETQSELLHGDSIVLAVCVKYKEASEFVLEYLHTLNDICEIRICATDRELLDIYNKNGFKVIIEENLYDILQKIKNFDYICVIHDVDVTSDIRPSCIGKSYLYSMWENIVKNKNYISGIIQRFKSDSRLGYLAAPQPIHAEYFGYLGKGWNQKFHEVKYYLQEMNIECMISMNKPPFSISNEFWIRGEIVRQINLANVRSDLLPYLWVYLVQAKGYYAGTIESSTYASMNEINLKNYLKQITSQIEELFGVYEDFPDMRKRLFQVALERFTMKSKYIMIYGTGGVSRMYRDIITKVVGYIVSDGQLGKKEVEGLPVRCLSEIDNIDGLGIVVCMTPEHQSQVIPLLEKKGIKNYICIW